MRPLPAWRATSAVSSSSTTEGGKAIEIGLGIVQRGDGMLVVEEIGDGEIGAALLVDGKRRLRIVDIERRAAISSPRRCSTMARLRLFAALSPAGSNPATAARASR
jgi:hypothetical protein